jgi:hypothetical protein
MKRYVWMAFEMWKRRLFAREVHLFSNCWVLVRKRSLTRSASKRYFVIDAYRGDRKRFVVSAVRFFFIDKSYGRGAGVGREGAQR